jgi:phosphonate transport system substrate-binding protein
MKTLGQPYRRFCVILGAAAIFCWAVIFDSYAIAQTESKTEPKAISLGLVSEKNRAALEEHFRDFVRYVARRLSATSAVEGKIVVAPTAFQMAKNLEQKRVDFYLESPYPTYLINYAHGAGKTLLRRWKGGMAEYQSLIVTKRSGTIKRLEDLRGKTMVFEDPGSTSGFLLPKFLLQRNGFKLKEKGRFDPYATETEIGYLFAKSQEKLVDLVLTGQAQGGAMSDDDFAALDAKKKSDLLVLAQTEKVPRHLVSVRIDLAPMMAGRLEEILLAMHEDSEGRRILHDTDQTAKFDRLPGGEAALRRRLAQAFYLPEKK